MTPAEVLHHYDQVIGADLEHQREYLASWILACGWTPRRFREPGMLHDWYGWQTDDGVIAYAWPQPSVTLTSGRGRRVLGTIFG